MTQLFLEAAYMHLQPRIVVLCDTHRMVEDNRGPRERRCGMRNFAVLEQMVIDSNKIDYQDMTRE